MTICGSRNLKNNYNRTEAEKIKIKASGELRTDG